MKTLIPNFSETKLNNSTYQKDGFIISSKSCPYVDIEKAFDGDMSTFYRSSISPVFPAQIIVTFPKSQNIYGFKISCNGGHQYYRMKQFDIYVMYDGETSLDTCVYSSPVFSNTDYSFQDVFDSPQKNVIAIALQCNSRYGDNSWGVSEFEVYSSNDLCLLKSNDRYYSINSKYYNSNAMMYTPLEGNVDIYRSGFLIDELFEEITINEETFSPSNKFDNFSIVRLFNNNIKLYASKSKSELLISKDYIDVSIADSIHNFTLLCNQSDNGKIRMAMSFDNGSSWYSYNLISKKIIPLNISVPLLSYAELSDKEKELWENAKRKILDIGISPNALKLIDFNKIKKSNNIKFAYVVSKSDYNDASELDTLSIHIDQKGIMRKMKNNEFNLYYFNNKIILTPSISTDVLQADILI